MSVLLFHPPQLELPFDWEMARGLVDFKVLNSYYSQEFIRRKLITQYSNPEQNRMKNPGPLDQLMLKSLADIQERLGHPMHLGQVFLYVSCLGKGLKFPARYGEKLVERLRLETLRYSFEIDNPPSDDQIMHLAQLVAGDLQLMNGAFPFEFPLNAFEAWAKQQQLATSGEGPLDLAAFTRWILHRLN